MSQYVSELTTFLVDDVWGELPSRVFRTLLHEGRLMLPGIIRKSHLSPNQVKHGLALLVQQGLIKHFSAQSDIPTQYEVDHLRAYSLVRAGKFIAIAEAQFGNIASIILSELLSLGHAKIRDLKVPVMKDMHPVDSDVDVRNGGSVKMPNGQAKTVTSPRQINKVMNQLLDAGFICAIHKAWFRSDADNRFEAEAIVKAGGSYSDPPKPKELPSFNIEVKRKIEEWSNGMQLNTAYVKHQKRSSDYLGTDESRYNKRVKMSNGYANGTTNGYSHTYEDEDDEDDTLLDEELVVRVNPERFLVILRNEFLTGLSATEITHTTAKVYAAFLQKVEPSLWTCRCDIEEAAEVEEVEILRESFSAVQVASSLDPMIELEEDAIGTMTNGFHNDDDNEGIGVKVEDGDDPPSHRSNKASRIDTVSQHLQLLAQDSHHFVQALDKETGGTAYIVDYQGLTKRLRQIELEKIINKRFGKTALRIIRILLVKGKLDERRIGELGMIPPKDMRMALMHMQEAGFVSLQEIPRDIYRQPSKTLYYYYFDSERVRFLVLEETYDAMLKCLQRARIEREKVHTVIEKSERTDVVGREDQFLTKVEREALSKYREKEEMLLTEVSRLDDLVMILRDF
ncbi:MAG: RNA polymerase III subunit C82 [Cirrosporium novae-zelandiae]|nr:MAG: RNA polymerase III subunit C82 [Cirrosporium novae-zelandiae]